MVSRCNYIKKTKILRIAWKSVGQSNCLSIFNFNFIIAKHIQNLEKYWLFVNKVLFFTFKRNFRISLLHNLNGNTVVIYDNVDSMLWWQWETGHCNGEFGNHISGTICKKRARSLPGMGKALTLNPKIMLWWSITLINEGMYGSKFIITLLQMLDTHVGHAVSKLGSKLDVWKEILGIVLKILKRKNISKFKKLKK